MARVLKIIPLFTLLLIGAPLPAVAVPPARATNQQLPNPELCPRFLGDRGGGFGEELLPPPAEETDDAAVLVKLKMGRDAIETAALSPSGRLVATATTSRQGKHLVQLWDSTTGRKLAETATDERVLSLAVAPDDRKVAAIQYKPENYVYKTLLMRRDRSGGGLAIDHELPAGSWQAPLAFTPDSTVLAVASESRVDLWDATTGELLHSLTGEVREIMIADAAGDYLAPYLFGGHTGPVTGLAFAPDGSRLATSSGLDDATVRIWDVGTGEHLSCIEVPAPSGYIGNLILPRYTPNGEMVAAFDTGGLTLYTWDAASRGLLGNVTLDRRIKFDTAEDLAYFDLSPDLNALLVATAVGNWAKVLDASNGDIVGMLLLPGIPLAIHFGADDATVLTAFSSAARTSIGSTGIYNEDEAAPASAVRGVWLWDASHPVVARAGESRNLLAVGVEQLLLGDSQKARASLRRAESLARHPGDDFAREVAATLSATTGQRVDELLQEGRVEDALAAAYNSLDYTGGTTADLGWNTLCRRGSLYGRPEDVLDACNRAVEIGPDDGAALRRRGLARALVGDTDGAVADFEAAVAAFRSDGQEWAVGEPLAWLDALYAGDNPFDLRLLSRLRLEADIGWPAVVASDGKLNVRDAPRTSGSVVAQLAPGSHLRIYGRSEDGKWLFVATPSHRGWVAAQYVEMDEAAGELPIFRE